MAHVYLDTSALVKLVVEERESTALRRSLVLWPNRVSSEVSVVELLRAVRRSAGNRTLECERRAMLVLSRIGLHALNRSLLLEAAVLSPRSLRTLDAIHLATALRIRDGLEGFIAYDRRLAEAAKVLDLPVRAPS